MTMELQIGPVEGFGPTVEDLELAWELRGDDVMRDYGGPAGTRPWAYWQFDVGEPKPVGWGAEAVRLAELGLLEAAELAAIRERANEASLRVGTPRELIAGGNRESGKSIDAERVELGESVRRALGERDG